MHLFMYDVPFTLFFFNRYVELIGQDDQLLVSNSLRHYNMVIIFLYLNLRELPAGGSLLWPSSKKSAGFTFRLKEATISQRNIYFL